MAEAIVQSACTKLRSAIEDEATARRKLTSDLLQEMKEALEAVDLQLLGEAERLLMRGSASDEERVRRWVRRVRKSAYGISDMVDELQDTRRASAAAGKVTSILPCFAVVGKKNPMAHKIKEMIDELKAIKLEFGDLGINLPPDFHVPDEAEEEKEEMQRIVYECNTYNGPVILPIKGQEDQAKTAFAKKVFNHTRFKDHSRVWVHLSETYDLRSIGVSIISQLSGEQTNIHHGPSNHDMEYITKCLHGLLNNLGSKEALVVLDGLHLKDEDCVQFKRMFCVGDKSCKVTVIATLRGDMGHSFFTNRPIKPECLMGDICWKIIKDTSGFEGRTRSDQERLEKIGREIAKQCLGEPFEAKVLGAMLRYSDAKGWEEALRIDLCNLSERNMTSSFLKIAYTIMPSSLRLCYAYCAMFPKGHPIAKDCLISQWVALGLIEPQPSDGSSVTQLAEQYIRSLLDLSLLQIMKPASTSEKDDNGAVLLTVEDVLLPVPPFYSWQSSIGLHDEFIIDVTRSEHNCNAIGMETSYQEFARDHGRYAVLTDIDARPVQLWSILLPQLRALHCIGASKMELNDDSFSSAMWLRILEIKEHPMQKLPETVCQLRHLACLSLSGCTELITLPDSFGDLLNLVYVDISHCSKLESLPKSLGKLTDLEYIDLSGCSALVTLPESFGKLIKLVRVVLSGCSGLSTLPTSIGKLINLKHVDLSGCTELLTLPSSFGKLIQLPHINLSGCSGLVTLPESFGKLTSLLHFDLSGCSGLSNLPQSIDGLVNLSHLDLSRCHALENLPETFCNLTSLQHLDLSFWSSFHVIQKAHGVTNLQHLNLSHPCASTAQHEAQSLDGLTEAMDNLRELRYLNLSMFLHFQPRKEIGQEEQIGQYLKNTHVLRNLEHLDLSHNTFLRNLPESLADLKNLHTLDLSGCTRLETVPETIYKMEGLKLIVLMHCWRLKSYQFVVGAGNNRGNFVQLEHVNCQEMEISCLEKVSLEEAQSIRLGEKGHLVKLKLCWTPHSQQLLDGNVLLLEMVPPHSLQFLEVHGYGGSGLSLSPMAWWRPSICRGLLNLAEVTLVDIGTCTQLPPLGLLPNLQRLVLRKMAITRINAHYLNFGNWPASKRLSKLTIDDMPALEAFNTRYEGAGGKELMFPAIDVLVIKKCPKLVFVPLPPRAHRLEVLEECNKLMTASELAGGGRYVEGPACIVAPVTELMVESSTVNFADWSLLHHLPGLHSLTINRYSFQNRKNYRRSKISFPQDALSSLQILCFSSRNEMWSLPENLGDLTSLRELRISCSRNIDLPESMKQLTSLKTMHLSDCGLSELPSWLGDLTSLEILTIHKCADLECFPESICKLINLKDLHVSECYRLKDWCESEQNKKVLAHIHPKYEEFVAPDPGKQSEQSENTSGSTSNTGNGNGSGGDGSSEPSEAQPSQRPNSPPRSPQWDIYLT